jgi:hypothetical protein
MVIHKDSELNYNVVAPNQVVKTFLHVKDPVGTGVGQLR